MIDTGKHRRRLTAKLARLRQLKLEEEAGDAKTAKCEHNWQHYRESIKPSYRKNSGFSGKAHFVVKGCEKCHHKERIRVVVENS